MPEDATAELMGKLGKEILHDIQPEGLKLMAEILRKIAGHIQEAADSHPDAQK